MFADQTSIPLPAMYVQTEDPAVTWTDGRVQPLRLWRDTSTGTLGTLKQRNLTNDGWDTLIDLDEILPAAHAASHQNGGGDEISVAGLSGVLADPQIADKVKESSGPTTLTVGAVADGEFLKRSGSSVVGAAAGGGGLGDVVGPGSATDNALARFDTTTGKLIQNSAVLADDNGVLVVPENASPSTPASGKVAVYAKADGKLYIKDDAGTETDLTASGSGIGGSTGSTDNALLRADGTGGSTAQASAITVDDNGAITIPEISAPSTPAAGKVVIYAKSDNKVYRKGEDGTEAELGGGGSPGGSTKEVQYNNAGALAGNSNFFFETSPAVKLVVPGGSSTVPGLSIASLGGFSVVSGNVAYVDGGHKITFSNGVYLPNDGSGIYWTNSTNPSGTQDVGLTRSAAGIVRVVNSFVSGQLRDLEVRQHYVDATMTASGTTGDRTINKSAGSVNFAAGASSLTVTDSLVTTNSIVIATIQTDDATATSVKAVPGSGSFTLKLNAAATAETKVAFLVINQ